MSIFGNFTEAMEDLICSERGAVNGFNDMVIFKMYDTVDVEKFGIKVDDVRQGDIAVNLIHEAVYNAINYVTGVDCAISECDVTVEYDARAWDLAMAECRYPLCTRTATREFMAFYNRYKVLNPGDSEYDFLLDRMSDILADILANTLLAKIFLSDKSVADTTLNGLDGLLVQWSADGTRVQDISSFFNAAGELDGKGVYEMIKMFARAYRRDYFTKKTEAQAYVLIPEDSANDLIDWLNDLGDMTPGDCTCYSVEGIIRRDNFTLDNLYINGIKIETIPYHDMAVQFPSLTENGDLETVVKDFFIVMTVKENVQFGAPKLDQFAQDEAFYDAKDRKYYFDIGYQFGVLVPSPVYLYGEHEITPTP